MNQSTHASPRRYRAVTRSNVDKTPQWERLDAETRAVAGQVVRYAVSGLLITLGVAFTYWALTEWAEIAPLVSNTIAFVGFTFVSYLTHSRFTFRGHGSRDQPMARQMRFFVTTRTRRWSARVVVIVFPR